MVKYSSVCFSYPESKVIRDALANVSFTIKYGQLVIIVGPNGSGKSTLVKLLNRQNKATKGELIVDGLPMDSYRASDLRTATADIAQDQELYPVSIKENIGIGYPDRMEDMDAIIKAAKLGGAFDVISRLKKGFDTVLEPVSTMHTGFSMGSWSAGGGHPLRKLMDEVEDMEFAVNVSGMFASETASISVNLIL